MRIAADHFRSELAVVQHMSTWTTFNMNFTCLGKHSSQDWVDQRLFKVIGQTSPVMTAV